MRTDIDNLEVQYARGNDDIAAYFGLHEPYGLVFIRVHFRAVAAGTGLAALTLSLDDAESEDFDVVLYQWVDNGVVNRKVGLTGGASYDVNLVIPATEQNRWLFLPRDRLKLAWTCPDDPGKIGWGIKVGLLPVRCM